MNIPPESITDLFITHLHSDHILGYGQFLLGGWALGRRKLRVVGPKGIKHYHNTMVDLFKEDINYRISLGRSPRGILENVELIEIEDESEIMRRHKEWPVTVTAKKVVHNVPTYAFRFEDRQYTVVHSGDTAPTNGVVDLAQEADLLIQDACLAVNAVYKNTPNSELQRIWEALQKEHCSPAQAADIAQRANVKTLVLTHFLPKIDEERARQEASARFGGEIIIGQDLQTISINQD
ncbi:Ribonuclease BN, tRNA processing enzyme [Alteribacillus persepolensis]|uniref:Ribonuclease BN, tRNA processing enzyme n=1 Tax=Alteribacillus persepolensis TaxID=568899 RepID=A0A1G7Y5T0_9BACI|nr:Ribonuclease BN, tRNA processing enzyme [Alteribacillus persepolensis]